MTFRALIQVLAVALIICTHAPAQDLPQRYITVDYPSGLNTGLMGINHSGQISGTFFDEKGIAHAFLYSDGKYSQIDFPGANRTFGFGINDSGKIVGYYMREAESSMHGFFYDQGNLIAVDVPKARATKAYGINSKNQIVGTYSDDQDVWHGFLFDAGKYSTLDVPGATLTEIYGINDAGQRVGFYWDANSAVHAFLYDKGKFTTIDYPGAVRTSLYGINQAGQMCGGFADANGPRGFVEGTEKARLKYPGALSTFAFGINDGGEVVGQYVDLDSVVHGYRVVQGKNQLPQISAHPDPYMIPSGGPGFQLDVRGIAFTPASVVQWNGVPRPTKFVNRYELYATIPASDIAQAGTVMLSVVNPGPDGGTSNVVQYRVLGAGNP